MKNKRINIAYICDENYVFNTIISIRSLKKHRKKALSHHVYVIAKDLSDTSINSLLAENNEENFCITVCKGYVLSEEKYKEHIYISKAALLKFSLPSLLKKIDRVLYVDGDIIFRDGFEDITNINIDNVYAAVVKDLAVYQEHVGYAESIGVKDYFNSGVMFLNLNKMRNDNIEDKLYDYQTGIEKNLFMEQDSLNVLFKNKVILTHPKFNFFYNLCDQFTNELIALFYGISEEDVDKLESNASIIHLVGEKKPWYNLTSSSLSEWLSYIQSVEEFLKWEKKAYSYNILSLEKQLQQSRRDLEVFKGTVHQLEQQKQDMLQRNHDLCDTIQSQVNVLELRIGALENWILIRLYKKIKRMFGFGRKS